MWQEAVVLFIGFVTAGYVGYRIFRLIKAAKHPTESPCDGCCGCRDRDKGQCRVN
ncbi:MAG: FeoB-associated Cys-rich membrane protein [Tannerellaceae bacterium]|jgi:hypothetical protein|nr:FeoB-associated Cys-rich membrane protein [Tannerellaceae bacterium]